jgi:hypothetical protein
LSSICKILHVPFPRKIKQVIDRIAMSVEIKWLETEPLATLDIECGCSLYLNAAYRRSCALLSGNCCRQSRQDHDRSNLIALRRDGKVIVISVEKIVMPE